MRVHQWRRAALSRAGQFMLQGALIAMCAAFGSTMAASLFLSNAGSGALPVYYLLFAALSVPVSLLYSGIIDRWPRKVTVAATLVVYTVGAMVCSVCLGDTPTGYYALYIVVGVCELMMYSLYYVLFADHFTVAEAKRHGGAMTISLGVGAVVGAMLLSLLTEVVEARRVFLVLPVLVGVTLAHLFWLTKREQPLDEVESGAEESIVDSLKAMPALARRYPIVLLMALSMFLNVGAQCIMEFEAFSIYAATYPDEAELASFMGLMTAVVDIVGILLVFFITNPLIPILGVARMNLIPPTINLITFLLLVVWATLPAGILAHLNYYPLEHSLNVPLFALIYNAVPHRFVGRVRVANDGLIFPFAQAAAGLVLLTVENRLSLGQISMIGAVIALGYLAAQWGTGRHYLRSLVKMLNSGSLDLEQVGAGFRLPDHYRRDIRAMLDSPEPDTVALGLELAARSAVALTAADLERALPMVPDRVARAAMAHLGGPDDGAAQRHLTSLLAVADPRTRVLAAESLLVRRLGCDFAPLLDDPAPAIRAIAACALLATPLGARARDVLARLDCDEAALAAVRVLGAIGTASTAAVLAPFLTHASAAVRRDAFTLAAQWAQPGERRAAEWARQGLADPHPAVRAAAAALMGKAATDREMVSALDRVLAAPEAEVRRAAALALGQRGAPGLTALAQRLRTADIDVADEIMDGIGAAGPDIADPVLFAWLSETVFPRVERNLAAMRRMPTGRPAWHPLELAIAASNARSVQAVLHALGVLGYTRVLRLVRIAMKANDPRTRANAVETLSSLAHRNYVVPLLPLFEPEVLGRAGAFSPQTAEAVLVSILAEDDPFLCAAAATVWHSEFGTAPPLSPDPLPLVAETLAAIRRDAPPRCYDEEPPMNRLAFLKSVSLFAEMQLDHLMAVDAAMTREQFLPGEAVVTEGELGDKLYIVFRGEVVIRKRLSPTEERELARLTSGQVFGEMSLFDDERRSATVVAATEAEFLTLDRDHFHSLACQRPEIPMQLCKVLASRLRSAIS